MSFDTLFKFEDELAKFTGAPYAVVTDGCTNAIELCFRYDKITQCSFPAFTYLSIPMLMHHLGVEYTMTNNDQWVGEYQFSGTRIWDSARLLQQGMYRPGQLQCLSFGNTKPLQIGRCGAILLDDYTAYQQLSMMRADGRDLHILPWPEQRTFTVGYHFCPSLESCKVGLEKLPYVDQTPQHVKYNDCRTIQII